MSERAEAGGQKGFAPKLLGFCEELRCEEVAIGTAEILDAFAAHRGGAMDAPAGVP